MENTHLSKFTNSFGLSLAVASVINGLLVIAKEKSPSVLTGMQKLTGHHWITHSVIVVGIFFIMGWLLALVNGGQKTKLTPRSLIGTLVGGVLAGGLLIVGFYLFGD